MTIDILKTNTLSALQKAAVLQLWNNEYPAQLAFASVADFENYLRVLSRPLHYIVVNDERIVAWTFAFDREGERWFAIIVDSTRQRTGYGTALIQELKKDNPVLNGWVTDHDRYAKCNGTAYMAPDGFYTRNGFRICEERLETEKLSAARIRWRRDQDFST